MKINSTATLIVLAANETPSFDGKNTYYNLALMQNGEVGNISCTKEVYEVVQHTMPQNVPTQFSLLLQNTAGGKYDGFRIIDVLPDKNTATGGAPKPDNTKPAK